jgi:invasion protein IalB
MKSVRFAGLIASLAAVTALAVPAALAAKAPAASTAPAAPAAAAPANPNKPVQPNEVKAFGDWTVRCYPVSSPSPCEMLEIRVAKKTGQRILSVLLAYIPARNEHVIQIAVPLGVALQNGLVLNSDTYKSGVLHFRRCDQLGCYVEGSIDGNAVNSLSRATKADTEIVSMDGKRYNFAFSLDGFTAAHNALVDLTKQKAVNPPAQPAPADGN